MPSDPVSATPLSTAAILLHVNRKTSDKIPLAGVEFIRN